MELIGVLLLLAFVTFLNIALYIPSLITVTEEEITANMRKLKTYDWFQQLTEDETYKKLLTYNQKVRKMIGNFSTKKLDQPLYQRRYRKRLQTLLEEESSHL